MEENQEQNPELLPDEITQEEEKERYVPRPWWQVAGAWVALALFLAFLAMYYLTLWRGGK